MNDELVNKLTKINKYFPVPLDVREIGGGKWLLLKDYIYRDPVYGTIIVPAGFITDLYSIPHPLRSIVSRVQECNGPAVVHDWIYRTQRFKQSWCDDVLQRAMKLHWSPVDRIDRKKIKWGLKLGGWAGYRKARKHYNVIGLEVGHIPTDREIIISYYRVLL